MNSLLEFVGELREKQLSVLQSIKELIKDADIKKLSYNGCALIVGVFLSRCGIKDALHPFGQAYFVCMLMYSAYYKSALVGCLIGWLTLFPKVPFSAMFVSAICAGLPSLLSKRFKVERTRLLKVAFVVASAVGIGIFHIGGRYFAIVGVLEAVAAVLCLFIYDKTGAALFVHKKRSRLTDDEAICLVFCLCTLIIFAGELQIYNYSVGLIIAGILTMGFGYLFGGTVGAAAGVLCGLCVSLGGGSIYTMGSMGVCGFFCGIMNKHGRIISILAYVAANALLTIYINGSSFVILPIGNTIVSGLFIIAVPKPLVDRVRELLCSVLSKSREERYYVEKYNSLAKEKIANLAGLFHTMSELFFTTTGQNHQEEITTLIRDGADEACADCLRHKLCWKDEFMATYGGFEEALLSIIAGKEVAPVPGCIAMDRVSNSLKATIERRRTIRTAKEDREDSNALLGEQLGGVSTLLTNLNSQINMDVRFESEIEKNIQDELMLFDVGVRDVSVMNMGGAYRCQIQVLGCGGNLVCKHKIQKTVSKFCGRPMMMKSSLCAAGKSGRCKLEFEAAKPLRVSSFVSQISKEEVCGDSYKVGYISDGEYMLCLSDGMGSGGAAKEESQACVDLLTSLFKAGFSEEVAFSTVNKLLILKSDAELFTTVDLCTVDVVRARMCFTKIGAVPSVVVKKGGGAYIIRGDSLPLGILEQVNEKSFQMDVEHGDMLIMFTDGVYDALGGLDGQIDKAILSAIEGTRDIKQMCSAILNRCTTINNGEKKDDMTILISTFKIQ